jgi:DnaK suppressor protein
MNKELLEQFKNDLEIRKLETEKELEEFAEKSEENKGHWETKFPNSEENTEVEDEADEVEEYENLLPVEYVLEEKLKNINLALQKIENGTYGICEDCRKEISEERLRILPEARTCNDCSASK